MNDIQIHRTPQSILGLKLVWNSLLSQTRNANFTQSWNWFQLTNKVVSNQFEPIVVETRYRGRTLGLVPFFTNVRAESWHSPQSLLGFGNAAPIGHSPTATWMTAAAFLRGSLSKSMSWELGPFVHGTGASTRVKTVFSQLALPSLGLSSLNMPVAYLKSKSSGKIPGQRPLARPTNWETLIGPPNRSVPIERRVRQTERFASLLSNMDLALTKSAGTFRFKPSDFDSIFEAFFDHGWIHLLTQQRDFGFLVLGDRKTAYLLPCGFRSLSESSQSQAYQEALILLANADFRRVFLLSSDPPPQGLFQNERSHYMYRYAARRTPQTTFLNLLSRLTDTSNWTFTHRQNTQLD